MRSALELKLAQSMRGPIGFDAATRGRYATDASIYQIMPKGVVAPLDEDDLQTAIEVARDLSIPVLARGAGSSQCGQTVGDALIIDVSRFLTGISQFDASLRQVTVQPGVTLDQLNAYLKPHNLFFPVDVSTSAQATLGGMAGNNSCGSRSLFYGNMVHNVLAIDAILSDGARAHFSADAHPLDARAAKIRADFLAIAANSESAISEHVPKMLRRVGGYNIDLAHCQSPRPYQADASVNMAQLLVGSEGTLAFTRLLKLQLAKMPTKRVLGVVNFRSLHEAMETTGSIVALGPTAVELVDRTMIDLALGNPAFRAVIDSVLLDEPQALLLVEFCDESEGELMARLERLAETLNSRFTSERMVRLIESDGQKALWEVRKAGLNIMMSMKGDGKPVSFIEDCAVPLEHLADYTARLTEVFARHGTSGTWYAHASVGTLHVRPILDMRRDGAKKMRAIAEEASALVRQFKGAYSGEHGDGLCRGEWIGWQFGPQLSSAFRQIKTLFDPSGRFAPQKMLDAPPMDDSAHFRFKPGYQAIRMTPKLDWSAFNVTRDPVTGLEGPSGLAGDPSGGLAMAVEMCNNNGHCRKFDAGTMCPSYRVTRDEKHVTRGRANTLRLALSNQLGRDGLASDEVAETLDLCVSCKGCRRECPTGIDMAKIKIEARAARLAVHGLTWRDKMIAQLPDTAWSVTRIRGVAHLINRLLKHAPGAHLALGFARQRAIPTFERPFLDQPRPAPPARPSIALWVDTFTNYFEPQIASDAIRVLEAAGEQVVLIAPQSGRPYCCGRTRLAAGQIDAARKQAKRSASALLHWIDQGCTIVGLEPSCLLTMRDEWLNLNLGARASEIATKTLLFEEYLARPEVAARLAPRLMPNPGELLVHGHCHQKAFDAFTPVLSALRLVPRLKVTPIESSCCGMAGSFGIEREHYDTSIAMAEFGLAPSIRSAPGAQLVADGTSCRQQIMHTTARQAVHTAQFLAAALDPS